MPRHFPKKRQKPPEPWQALIYEHSPYLTELLTREKTDFFEDVIRDAEKNLAQKRTTPEVMKILRGAKRKIALLTAVADLKGEWDDTEVMARLSDFADFCVRHALHHLLRRAEQEKKIRKSATGGVSVIAVGKWGARELNYSSDIDLLVIFDPRKAPVVDRGEVQNFYIRLTRDLARLLDQPTEDGYVFRTDLRLRPDPGAMPLAISIDAAETYYGSLGQNWERAAMIKARPVAGDETVGRDFMAVIHPWIWRKNLDFAAIQDIHSIKRQINAKQGKAGAKAPEFDMAAGRGGGFNVKLGHGGIREIEFFAQTQQLIFGGREPRLRPPDTLSALKALEETGHLAEKTRKDLSAAYLFLRRVEHRLQMQEDRQTHSLPSAPPALEKFARFMGYASAKKFFSDMERHTGLVKSLYAELFTESQSLSQAGNLVFTGVEDDPETLDTLRGMGFRQPQTVTASVRGWHHGRYRSVRSERARQLLTEMTPHLLKTLGATPHPDDAFLRFDRFLSRLPSGVPIFTMFAHNPRLMELVAEIMGTAPAMADHLGTHPDVLQEALSKDYLGKLPDIAFLRAELHRQLDAARDYQDVLDVARRFARDRRFHAGVHMLKALTPFRRICRYLTDVAEVSVTSLLPHIEKDFERTHGRFKTGSLALVAMGSFAAQRLAFDSDLDIVAVYDVAPKEKNSNGKKPLPANVYYIRLMQRVLTALTAPTAEGILYEVDTRLRPAGLDGPLATSFEGFSAYHRKQAWTWEHMSLISSRVISGRADLREKIEGEIKSVVAQRRDPDKLKGDVADMRRRVEKQFGTKDPWRLKHHAGGMMDILFIAHYLTLLHAHRHKALAHPDVVTCIERHVRKKTLLPREGRVLTETYALAHDVQGFLRLTAELPFDPARASLALKTALAKSVGMKDFRAVERKLKRQMMASAKIYDKLLK